MKAAAWLNHRSGGLVHSCACTVPRHRSCMPVRVCSIATAWRVVHLGYQKTTQGPGSERTTRPPRMIPYSV